MTRSLILTAAVSLLLACPAVAQTQVRTLPLSTSATNASGTVATTDTFQAVFAANANRTGCEIQNIGTNPMYIFQGTLASATKDTSYKLYPATTSFPGVWHCEGGGLVAGDAISLTGTSTEKFSAVAR